MDSTDIETEALTKIFLKPQQFTPKCIESIVEWNESFDPSFGMVKNQIKKFLHQNQENSISAVRDVIKTLDILVKAKCPRNFLRAYLANIKMILQGPETKSKQILEGKREYYEKNWKTIYLQLLQPYYDTFNLKKRIKQEEINEFIESLIQNKKYNNCLGFIKFLGVGENHKNIEKLVGKMTNKKDASKAADYVKNLKLNPKDYPALSQRLYKNTARHFLTKQGWQYAEQIFETYPQALACIIEDLIYKNKTKEALSIWSRHPLWEYLQKEQSKQFFKEHEKLPNEQILINEIQKDIFGPSNPNKYFSFQDFGIQKNRIIWIDKKLNPEELQKIMQQIYSSPILGIDTESIVGQTKFNTSQNAALIQISTKNTIYLIDGFEADHKIIKEYIKNAFQKRIIIGHSFTNDTDCMAKAFGFKSEEQLKIRNLVDLCSVYKSIFPESKYCSLAHICKSILGKEICKQQTLTNWRRRPLRKNQIHYAGLDAYILIKIYEKLVQEYGQLIHYYADIEINDSF